MADFDANNIVKLSNAATKADFEKYMLTPVYETHKPHANTYDGEGTPNPTTEYFSWVARECPPVNADNEHCRTCVSLHEFSI